MTDFTAPLTIEATRGGRTESVHHVHAVVADAGGAIVRAFGEPDLAVFPRSAIKALQALPLVESGAADRFGFGPQHLALACASHSGEPAHVDAAREMLSAAGLTQDALECGPQPPARERDRQALWAAGAAPSALHNNCSGKHAGFLATAVLNGEPTDGYVTLGHPVQARIAAVLHEATGVPHGAANAGIDGCAIPTYALPIAALARAFARFAVAGDGDGPRGAAMARLREACLAHPFMVAGTQRCCTVLMEALGPRAFLKTGAEGVYVAALPQEGLAIALKAHDGATRAAETAAAALLGTLLRLDEREARAVASWAEADIANRRGMVTGAVRVAPGQLDNLRPAA